MRSANTSHTTHAIIICVHCTHLLCIFTPHNVKFSVCTHTQTFFRATPKFSMHTSTPLFFHTVLNFSACTRTLTFFLPVPNSYISQYFTTQNVFLVCPHMHINSSWIPLQKLGLFLNFFPITIDILQPRNSFNFTPITPIQPMQQKIITGWHFWNGFFPKSIHELRILITNLAPTDMASL
jgi:hypothetical protein